MEWICHFRLVRKEKTMMSAEYVMQLIQSLIWLLAGVMIGFFKNERIKVAGLLCAAWV